MKDLFKDDSHENMPPEDREFYIGGGWLTALGAVIAVVAI